MALKKANKTNDEVLKKQLKNDIEDIKEQIRDLQDELLDKEAELLELDIKPFKIGGYALVNIPSGRTTKEQKCLLECVGDTLYARPVKEDGELSGRHFSIIPVSGHKYSEYLKEVK